MSKLQKVGDPAEPIPSQTLKDNKKKKKETGAQQKGGSTSISKLDDNHYPRQTQFASSKRAKVETDQDASIWLLHSPVLISPVPAVCLSCLWWNCSSPVDNDAHLRIPALVSSRPYLLLHQLFTGPPPHSSVFIQTALLPIPFPISHNISLEPLQCSSSDVLLIPLISLL